MGIFSYVKDLFSEHKKQELFSSIRNQVYLSNYQHPVWSNRNFLSFADEGYSKNVIVFRCINMITVAAASVPFVLYKKVNGSDVRVTEHPLLDLLNMPNNLFSKTEFMEVLYSYRLISGNVYVLSVKNSSQNIPSELYALRPDRVNIIEGDGYHNKGYRYKCGKIVQDFPVDPITGYSDMLHIKNFNPINDLYGLSPVEAASYSIDQHNQAGQWIQSLLQNGAKPSGALIVKQSNDTNSSLSSEEYERLKSENK